MSESVHSEKCPRSSHLPQDLEPMNVAAFSVRIRDVAVGRLAVPGEAPAAASKWSKPAELEAEPEPAAAVDAVAAAGPAPGEELVCPLSDLRAGVPAGVDAARKEAFLSVDEFAAQFGTAQPWAALPSISRSPSLHCTFRETRVRYNEGRLPMTSPPVARHAPRRVREAAALEARRRQEEGWPLLARQRVYSCM
jgi:hypothetical protein